VPEIEFVGHDLTRRKPPRRAAARCVCGIFYEDAAGYRMIFVLLL
jgi:hypothetical protein